ncbi:putative phosphoribosyl-dephospho-CoA transferase [Herminiimonas arsenicoxydans]|uniref:Phosphoribosyl-dephospho-CoA transferase n=1 Tax=Herminiimonas arsenicoxydans TaxID=204773 RepID=A4G557_HERAR|nr:putative phosphoribosyl-dephospho-CoA transferase [Herminiimonas arsenicoxydans]
MFYRHNRVWLSANGWQAACARLPAAHAKELMRWAEHDWPAIVRRSDADAQPDTLCLGVAPPPEPDSGVKTRIPFTVGAADIVRHEAPLVLSAAESALSPAWRCAFSALAVEAGSRGLEFRVYGSVALQAITSLPYLAASSDIDLLFYPRTQAQLQEGMALLSLYAKQLPLDGEIVFPSARAVAWKEWAQAFANPVRPRVLAKGMSSLNLVQVADLLAELEKS